MPPESQTVTLELPYSLFQQAQRTAEHTHRSVEDILVESVASALSKVKDLPQELANDVSDLAFLNDAGLWKIVRGGLPAEHHGLMDDLLDQKQRGELSSADQLQLDQLIAEYQSYVLRRSQAAALLQRRGYDMSDPSLLNTLP